jgi:hypothetical protein
MGVRPHEHRHIVSESCGDDVRRDACLKGQRRTRMPAAVKFDPFHACRRDLSGNVIEVISQGE